MFVQPFFQDLGLLEPEGGLVAGQDNYDVLAVLNRDHGGEAGSGCWGYACLDADVLL